MLKNYLIKTKVLKINGLKIYIPEPIKHNMFEIVLIAENEKTLIPTVCLVEETCEEDYDYDWEENLEFKGLLYTKIYHPISFNPFTGHKFHFNTGKTKDITNEYNEIMNSLEEAYKMRKSKKKDEIISGLEVKLQELFLGVPLIFEKAISFTDDDAYDIVEFIENINKFGCEIFQTNND